MSTSKDTTAEEITVRPEIAHIRSLLRMIGSDNPEERETAEAEVTGVSRLVSALVALVRLESALHPTDDNGVTHDLDAIIARAGRLHG